MFRRDERIFVMRIEMLKRLLTGMICICTVAPTFAAETILIGQSVPLTGDNAAFGKDIRDGALAYFKTVNEAGGVGGKKIELVSLDDANDRKRAGDNATKLLSSNQAVALFGFASATLSLDALAQAEKVGAAVFATFTGASAVRKSAVTFTLRPTYEEETGKILEFWQGNGIQRITVVHYDDEVGLQNFKSISEQVKLRTNQPAKSVALKRNATVDAALVTSIVDSDPELVLNTVASSPAAKIVLELRKLNKYYLMSSTSFVGASQFVKLVGAQGAGVSITQVVPSPISSKIPVVNECRRALSGVNVELNYTNLEACIGAKVLVEGLRPAGRDPTRASLLNALQGLGTYDVGGFSVTFNRASRHGSKWMELSVINKAGDFRI
jgi:branched-chain amino acid transport system substrate-binding protein